MSGKRIATRAEVEMAALVGRILGGYEESFGQQGEVDHPLRCVSRAHACEDCKHVVQCAHEYPWECIADAIGANETALALYLCASGDLAMYPSDWEEIWAEDPHRADNDLRWLDSIGNPKAEEIDRPDLEAAGLLEEGVLPPGWRLR